MLFFLQYSLISYMPNPRHHLPDNDAINTERRSYGETDRTWSDEEFAKMVEIAEQTRHKDYIAIFYLARYAGLRIHECFRIDTATARNAVKNMAITIKGKGGKVRTVHLTRAVCDKLSEMLAAMQQGHKLFVPDDMPTDAAITRLQQFIIKHREKVRDCDADVQITAHGLRHCYAADTYSRLISEGKSQRESKRATSKLLGHNRPEVTNIYLASLKGKHFDK